MSAKTPFAALEAAKALNLGTILTSGQAASAPQALPCSVGWWSPPGLILRSWWVRA